MSTETGIGTAPNRLSFSLQLDVTYSCGSCGYMLNLSSCNRNATNIDSKYCKSIKRGILSFYAIDESRVFLKDELSCKPYFISKKSWGLFRQRTKLLCQKCDNHVGNAYDDYVSKAGSNNLDCKSGGKAPYNKYYVKLNALQPSESGTLIFS